MAGKKTDDSPGGSKPLVTVNKGSRKFDRRRNPHSLRTIVTKFDPVQVPLSPAEITAVKRKFIIALAEYGLVKHAAGMAGITRKTVEEWQREDKDFALEFERAVKDSADELERVATLRAKRKSDLLAIFLLKGLKPEKFRDNHKVEFQLTPTEAAQKIQAALAEAEESVPKESDPA